MTIKEYEDKYRNYEKSTLEVWLKRESEKIKFLESIYRVGGENYLFSETFGDAAEKERNEICKLTSALHELVRNKK